MNYCKKCVLPESRPNLFILPDGICTACHSHQGKKNIDWVEKEKKFRKLIKKIKDKKLLYDCLIPVSGGKDSTWQVLLAKKYKLNSLAFTYKPVLRTKIGQDNIDNLKKIGIHHIEFSVNESVEKKFLKKAFIKNGAIAIPMHLAMWSMSYNLAQKFSIPYIFWGENSAREYGGSKQDKKMNNLDDKWIKKYGINFGKKAEDWVDSDLSQQDLAPFIKNIKNKKNIPISLFMGDFFNWDPQKTFQHAKKFGFRNYKKKTKTGYYNYADIDDDLISIHHYLKVYKFGFSRLQDNLSLEIRNRRIKRSDAVKIINKVKFNKPIQDIKKFCRFINISEKYFFTICDKFRNKDIWFKKNNKWSLRYPLK
jgi:N-acetyl sugar amidotransferase